MVRLRHLDEGGGAGAELVYGVGDQLMAVAWLELIVFAVEDQDRRLDPGPGLGEILGGRLLMPGIGAAVMGRGFGAAADRFPDTGELGLLPNDLLGSLFAQQIFDVERDPPHHLLVDLLGPVAT
jgi:hypothetical protein